MMNIVQKHKIIVPSSQTFGSYKNLCCQKVDTTGMLPVWVLSSERAPQDHEQNNCQAKERGKKIWS
jgi:hypothetical protein